MDTANFFHGLGDRVKDRISGLEGIVISRSQHLYGCTRYWVCPEVLKDGKPIEGAWYDEPQLEIIKTGVHIPHNVVTREQRPVEPQERGYGFDLPSSSRK